MCIRLQGHRDEIITITANPFVDQVISAGMGESSENGLIVDSRFLNQAETSEIKTSLF